MTATNHYGHTYDVYDDYYLQIVYTYPCGWADFYGFSIYGGDYTSPWTFEGGVSVCWVDELAYLGTIALELLSPPPSITLTATGNREVGKPDHYISLINTGNVTTTAALNPSTTSPSVISWTGGTAGSNNLQRVISASSASDTTVTAQVESSSASVVIHLVDAKEPPAAAVDAPKTYSSAGNATPNAGNFGQVFFLDSAKGVEYPTYTIDPYFSKDRWFFRVRNIQHSYKIGTQSLGRIDLPNGNPTPFPQVNNPAMNLQQSHQAARTDLDTSGLMDMARGPRRMYYYVDNISLAHENFHVTDFYTNYWKMYMGLFESDDIETDTFYVYFDCNDPKTTTGPAAVDSRKNTVQGKMFKRFDDSMTAYYGTYEMKAHNYSNPMYIPIHDQIPNP